jgi:hypothetical protein
MSEFCQVLVMMAAPAAFLLTIRHFNVRADRAFDAAVSGDRSRGSSSLGTENRPAQ